jgi:DnaJ like chaperone protein
LEFNNEYDCFIYPLIKSHHDPDWAYEILEVSKDSSDEDIKQAYMKKIKESHPDKLPANTPEWIIKVAQEKFSKLQEAYKAICEAKKQ